MKELFYTRSSKIDFALVIVWVLVVIGTIVSGCNEVQQSPDNAPVLGSQILQANPEWIEVYGDTPITQLMFNATAQARDDQVLRQAIFQIAVVIRNAHATDPNEIRWRESVEERINRLISESNSIIQRINALESIEKPTCKQLEQKIVLLMDGLKKIDEIEKALNILETEIAKESEPKICEIPRYECPTCREDFFKREPNGIWFSSSGFIPEPTDECDDYVSVMVDKLCEEHKEKPKADCID